MQTYTWHGATCYDGEVLDGFRHGYGRLTVADGSSVVYEGMWQHGKRHGRGGVLYYNADRTAYYQGAAGPEIALPAVALAALCRCGSAASVTVAAVQLGSPRPRLGLLVPCTALLTAAGLSVACLALP